MDEGIMFDLRYDNKAWACPSLSIPPRASQLYNSACSLVESKIMLTSKLSNG